VSLHVRRVVPGDIEALLPLCRQFHAESPVHRLYAFDEGTVRILLGATVADSNWLLAVAIDDDTIVGMMMLFCMSMFFSTAREIGDLTFWVRPERRGGRAAPLLMKEALRWAATMGAAKVQLGITTGINHNQVERFYRKAGFEQSGILMTWRPPPAA
jgi:GNAT superfamily N-acetyltransferase